MAINLSVYLKNNYSLLLIWWKKNTSDMDIKKSFKGNLYVYMYKITQFFQFMAFIFSYNHFKLGYLLFSVQKYKTFFYPILDDQYTKMRQSASPEIIFFAFSIKFANFWCVLGLMHSFALGAITKLKLRFYYIKRIFRKSFLIQRG